MNFTSTIRLTDTQRYALIGTFFGMLFPLVATIIRTALMGLPQSLSGALKAQAADPLLWIIDSAPLFLGLFAAFAGRRQDRVNALNTELMRKQSELEISHQNLEQRVADRTKDIERNAAEFQFVANAARSIVAVQDLDVLLPQIANLVSRHFGCYHVAIYIIDDSHEHALLQAASSDTGLKMLARQYRVQINNSTIIGSAALLGEPRFINDLEVDSGYYKTPELPDSRSEIGIPLKIRDQAIGILDLQSMERDAFNQEIIAVLAILADQIAIAIDNARLFTQARAALTETQATVSKYIKQEWKAFSTQSRQNAYVYDGRQVIPLTASALSERAKNAAKTGRLRLDKHVSHLTIPIRLRGQTIGTLQIKSKSAQHQWTEEEVSMLEAAADRAALALENARLVESAQRRAARERAIGEISSKIGAVSERNSILQTAVEELGRKIGNTEIFLELETPA